MRFKAKQKKTRREREKNLALYATVVFFTQSKILCSTSFQFYPLFISQIISYKNKVSFFSKYSVSESLKLSPLITTIMSSTSFTDLLASSGVDCYEDDEDLRVSGSSFGGYCPERTVSGLSKFKAAQPPPLPISPSSHNFTFSDFLDSPLLLSSSHVKLPSFFIAFHIFYCINGRKTKKQILDFYHFFFF